MARIHVVDDSPIETHKLGAFYEVNLKAILRDERFFDVTQDRML